MASGQKSLARLNLAILQYHFGPSVATVAQALINRGPLTITLIQRRTSLTLPEVRSCLIILLAHQLAVFRDGFYSLSAEGIVFRLRMPRFLQYIEEHYGALGLEMAMVLATRGFSSLATIRRKLARHPGLSVFSEGPPTQQQEACEDPVKRIWATWCLENLIQTVVMEEKAKEEVDPAILQAAAAAGSTVDSSRFPAVGYAGRRKREEEVQGLKTYDKGSSATAPDVRFVIPPFTRKRRRSEDDKDTPLLQPNKQIRLDFERGARVKSEDELPAVSETENAWFNFRRMNVLLRHVDIEDYTQNLLMDSAAHVVRITAKQACADIENCSEPSSSPIKVAWFLEQVPDTYDFQIEPQTWQIETEVQIREDGSSYERPKPQHRYLLGMELFELLKSEDIVVNAEEDFSGTGSYVFCFDKLLPTMRMKILEGIIRDKLGTKAMRVFKLLLATGKMDEAEVSRAGLLSVKHARALLHRLHQSGLVELQEIPRTNDRISSRAFLLWYVSPSRAYLNLVHHLHHAIANLLDRREQEYNVNFKDLVTKTARTDVVNDPTRLLTPAELESAEKLSNAVDCLECSVVRLDRLSAVLRDYV